MPAIEPHRAWLQQRLENLCAPDGWLTLIDLIWFDDGSHPVGSDPAAAIRTPETPAHWGMLEIDGTKARWITPDEPPLVLESDRHSTPTLLRAGRISIFLIERDGRLALRVRDEQAATRTGFKGISSFSFAPEWQVEAQWDGEKAHFVRDGAQYSLRPQNPAADTLQFVIADQTSGRETYGGGRFLFVPAPSNSTLQLDFNRAINPPCAFTAFAVCPLPPAENRLPFAVLAGEKTYR